MGNQWRSSVWIVYKSGISPSSPHCPPHHYLTSTSFPIMFALMIGVFRDESPVHVERSRGMKERVEWTWTVRVNPLHFVYGCVRVFTCALVSDDIDENDGMEKVVLSAHWLGRPPTEAGVIYRNEVTTSIARRATTVNYQSSNSHHTNVNQSTHIMHIIGHSLLHWSCMRQSIRCSVINWYSCWNVNRPSIPLTLCVVSSVWHIITTLALHWNTSVNSQ